jgi:hypothetical protein
MKHVMAATAAVAAVFQSTVDHEDTDAGQCDTAIFHHVPVFNVFMKDWVHSYYLDYLD